MQLWNLNLKYNTYKYIYILPLNVQVIFASRKYVNGKKQGRSTEEPCNIWMLVHEKSWHKKTKENMKHWILKPKELRFVISNQNTDKWARVHICQVLPQMWAAEWGKLRPAVSSANGMGAGRKTSICVAIGEELRYFTVKTFWPVHILFMSRFIKYGIKIKLSRLQHS